MSTEAEELQQNAAGPSGRGAPDRYVDIEPCRLLSMLTVTVSCQTLAHVVSLHCKRERAWQFFVFPNNLHSS